MTQTSPETETAERVARKLRAHEWGHDHWNDCDTNDKKYWLMAAKVAIEAIGVAQPALTSPESAQRALNEVEALINICNPMGHPVSNVVKRLPLIADDLRGLAQSSQETESLLSELTNEIEGLKHDVDRHMEIAAGVELHYRAALETAAARFNMMAGVGLVNGVDPKVGYRECMAALSDTSTDAPAQRSREQVIEECANHLERKADMLTNSLHCGDNSATIAAAHKKSRQLYEAAAIINELALAPSDTSTTRESK